MFLDGSFPGSANLQNSLPTKLIIMPNPASLSRKITTATRLLQSYYEEKEKIIIEQDELKGNGFVRVCQNSW